MMAGRYSFLRLADGLETRA